ncbi:hypothetical protein PC118_g25006, partial [Phytophthora cactorum]
MSESAKKKKSSKDVDDD